MLLFGVIYTTMRGTIHNNALNVQLLVIATCSASLKQPSPRSWQWCLFLIPYIPCL